MRGLDMFAWAFVWWFGGGQSVASLKTEPPHRTNNCHMWHSWSGGNFRDHLIIITVADYTEPVCHTHTNRQTHGHCIRKCACLKFQSRSVGARRNLVGLCPSTLSPELKFSTQFSSLFWLRMTLEECATVWSVWGGIKRSWLRWWWWWWCCLENFGCCGQHNRRYLKPRMGNVALSELWWPTPLKANITKVGVHVRGVLVWHSIHATLPLSLTLFSSFNLNQLDVITLICYLVLCLGFLFFLFSPGQPCSVPLTNFLIPVLFFALFSSGRYKSAPSTAFSLSLSLSLSLSKGICR